MLETKFKKKNNLSQMILQKKLRNTDTDYNWLFTLLAPWNKILFAQRLFFLFGIL